MTSAVAVIALVALGLRLCTLGAKNIWVDESASWVIATSALPQLFARTAADIHPPLYYLGLKAWMAAWGDSPVALRGFSVAASMTGLALFWRLADRTTPRLVALAALAWLALSPHDIAYAQEARMYAPVTAVVLAACLSARRWIESAGANRRALALYALASWAAVSMHYFALFLVAAIAAHGLRQAWRDRVAWRGRSDGATAAKPWREWVIAHVGIALAYGVWAAVALDQLMRGQPWRPRLAPSSLPHALAETMRAFLFGDVHPPPLASWTMGIAGAVVATGLAITCVRALRRSAGDGAGDGDGDGDGHRSRERDAFWAIVSLGPLAAGLALLPFAGDMDLSRYLAYTLPLVMLAVAHGLARLPRSAIVTAALLTLMAVLPLPSLRAYYASPVKDYDPRPLAVWLDAHTRDATGAHDPIFVAPGYTAFVLQYVARDVLAGQLDTPDDLAHVEAAADATSRPVWLVADYRWPGFAALATDRCLHAEHPVPMDDGRLRLFRVTCAAGRSDAP